MNYIDTHEYQFLLLVAFFMNKIFDSSEPEIIRGNEKQCQVCQRKFTIIIRQHQCKRCFKAVCSDCGNFKRDVFSFNFNVAPHRVCKSCKDGSEYICQFVKNNSLKFGEMSEIGMKWIKKINKKPNTQGNDISQHKLFSRQIFNQLWNSYSFELRELVGLLTFQYQQSGVYDVVYNVYTTVISASPSHTLSQVIYLIIFVLCFCSTDKSAILVLYLLQLKVNQPNLKNTAINYIKALPLRNQFSKIIQKYMDSFLVNCITIQCSISLICKIMDKKNIDQQFMMFAAHIFINRQIITAKSTECTRKMMDTLMLRNCLFEQITSNYKFIKVKNIHLDNENKKQYSQLFSIGQSNEIKSKNNLKITSLQRESLKHVENQKNIENETKTNQIFIKRQVQQANQLENQDSFSFQIINGDSDSFQLKNGSQENTQKNNILLQQYDFSLKSNSCSVTQQSSPFRKAIVQQFSNDQIPNFFQLIAPIRKSIDRYDSSEKQKNQICSKCQYYQQQLQKINKILHQKQILLSKNKQQLQKSNEEKEQLIAQSEERNQKIFAVEQQLNKSEQMSKQLFQKYSVVFKEMGIIRESQKNNNNLLEQLKKQYNSKQQQLNNAKNQILIFNQKEKQLIVQKQMFFQQLQRISQIRARQKNQNQDKILQLTKEKMNLENIVKNSINKVGQQNDFFVKKSQEQQKVIIKQSLQLQAVNSELILMKEKMGRALKQSIKSAQNMKVLRLAFNQSQQNVKASNQKLIKCQTQLKQLIKQRDLVLKQKKYSLVIIQQQKNMLIKNKKQLEEQLNIFQRKKEIQSKQKSQEILLLSNLNKQLQCTIEQRQTENSLLQNKFRQQQNKNKDLYAKLKQISELMMQIEDQKIQISEQNFSLHQILKKHKIKIN